MEDDRLHQGRRQHHQHCGSVLHRRCRRGDRVQDEPVQHRLERSVPPRRARRWLGRCRGRSSTGAPRAVRVPRRHHCRRMLGAHRGDPQRHAQRQRRRGDDHAQLHRGRPRVVPARRGVPRRGERWPRRSDQGDAGIGSAPVAQQPLRTRRVRLRSRGRAVRIPPVRHRARDRVPHPAQPQPVRLRAATVRPEPRRRAVRRRQPQAHGPDHACSCPAPSPA